MPQRSNRSDQNAVRMFCFPKAENLQKRWITAIRREKWTPTKNSRICTTHFINADKTTIPQIFEWTTDKSFDVNFNINHITRLVPENTRTHKDTRISKKKLVFTASKISNLEAKLADANSRIKKLETLVAEKDTEISVLKGKRHNFLNPIDVDELSCDELKSFTSLSSSKPIMILVEMLERAGLNYYYEWNVTGLPSKIQVFILLMKLKLDLPNNVIGTLFRVSKTTISNIVNTLCTAFHELFFEGDGPLQNIPTLFLSPQYLPRCFTSMPNCRIVLDCAEIVIESPSTMKENKIMYSYYKSTMTAKFLVGCAPNSTITFVSDLFGRSTSDKGTVKANCILELEADDLILADKGFEIFHILPPGVSLYILYFSHFRSFRFASSKK